jgi:4-hydroxybutyrate CoA-transferase
MNKRLCQAVSAAEAVERLQSGMNVFVHGAAATPTPLLEALCLRKDLTDLKLYHMHTAGPAPFVDPTAGDRVSATSTALCLRFVDLR